MTFQLGVYSFGNTPVQDDGGLAPTSQAIRDVLEAVRLAEEVGLDFFGVGEHHRHIMPISSPSSVINAAAAVTTRIGLGSTVTVLSTDDPVRVYQQHATAAALAPGRIEITVGRGSGTDSYPLYGYRVEDYDSLYAAKLDLLLAVNANERVTWDGPHRDLPAARTQRPEALRRPDPAAARARMTGERRRQGPLRRPVPAPAVPPRASGAGRDFRRAEPAYRHGRGRRLRTDRKADPPSAPRHAPRR